MKKRIYNTENRQIQANQTKDRILAAAKILFESKGFDSVTIEGLAQHAGVSAPTIYSIFQSKRGVLRALMDEALPPKQFEELVQKVSLEKTSKGRLEIAACMARKLYDAEREQMNAFRGASVLAPEFKALENEREERRYLRQEDTVKAMEKDKSLAPGINITKARDILWTFTGRDIYRLLVIEKGWSPDEYEKWLAQSLIQLLTK